MRNINPEIWGKYYWKVLEYTCLSYPENPSNEDKENMKLFLSSFAQVLPCEKCRNHYKINLMKYPLNDAVMSDRHNLLLWLLLIHNSVNISLGKREMSEKEFMARMDSNMNKDDYKIITIILLIILVIILIICVRM